MRVRVVVAELCSGLLFLSALHASGQLFPDPEEYVGKDIPTQVLRAFEQVARLRLPTNSIPLGVYLYRGQDKFIDLKLQVPRAELDYIIHNSPFKDKALSTQKRSTQENDSLKWWRPDEAKKFLSGEATLPDAKHLRILIDLDRKKMVTVYLEWF